MSLQMRIGDRLNEFEGHAARVALARCFGDSIHPPNADPREPWHQKKTLALASRRRAANECLSPQTHYAGDGFLGGWSAGVKSNAFQGASRSARGRSLLGLRPRTGTRARGELSRPTCARHVPFCACEPPRGSALLAWWVLLGRPRLGREV